MSNYDYNKGYRGFHFEKKHSIDSSLPILSRYRSTREANSLLNLSNAQRVEEIQSHSWPDNHSHSLPVKLPNILTPNLPPALEFSSAPAPSTPAQDFIEYSSRFDLCPVAISPAPVTSQRDDKMPNLLSTAHTKVTLTDYGSVRSQRMPQKRQKTSHKSRKSKERANMQRNPGNANDERGLSECLVIQNGIERLPRSSRKRLLSEEKTNEIMNWMNGSE